MELSKKIVLKFENIKIEHEYQNVKSNAPGRCEDFTKNH